MRILVVRDKDGQWYLRRVKYNHQDDVEGEMVYHCDKHLGGPYPNLLYAQEAVENLNR